MSKCVICGDPMQKDEEMFKLYGFSCSCPKPPRNEGVEAVKKLFKDATGVNVGVRVDNGEFILIDPAGQEFKTGLVRKQ